MSDNRTLVTGAAGYVGRHVVRELIDRGSSVTAIVRPGRGGEVDPRATVVEADVLSPQLDLAGLLAESPFDAVVHLAWQDGFQHNAPSHLAQLSQHFRLLSQLADLGVPRIAILGTMHEIGYWEGAIDAQTPTNPLSLYGVAKDALRRSTSISMGDRVQWQWLRCYYIYGDDRRNKSIFSRLLAAVDEGRTTFPFTRGLNKYDFIEVGELAAQIATVVLKSDFEGVINCCSGEPMTLGEKVQEFIDVNDLPIRLEVGAYPDRPYDSPGVWGNPEAIQRVMADAG